MAVRMRSFSPNDEAFLFELYAETRASELDAWGWDAAQRKTFLEQQFAAQQQSYRFQFPDADHKIILREDREIGRMMVARSEEEFRLIDIALVRKQRSGGIGTRLVRDLLDESAKAAKPFRLRVLKGSRAVRLYKRLGLTVIGDDGLYLEMEVLPEPADMR